MCGTSSGIGLVVSAGVYNFQNTARSRTACEQGATFRRRITLLNPDETPVDLTGYSIRMQVRNKTQMIVELTTENGRVIVEPLHGRFTLFLGASLTASLPVGFFTYDIEIASSNDNVQRALEGKFQISGEVTR